MSSYNRLISYKITSIIIIFSVIKKSYFKNFKFDEAVAPGNVLVDTCPENSDSPTHL